MLVALSQQYHGGGGGGPCNHLVLAPPKMMEVNVPIECSLAARLCVGVIKDSVEVTRFERVE